MVRYSAQAIFALFLSSLAGNVYYVHGKEENVVTVVRKTEEDGIIDETFKKGQGTQKGKRRYYDVCRSCLPIRTFDDFDRLIIERQREHVLNLCGWEGSITWPADKLYTFEEAETVFVLNCCGQSCTFDGRGEEPRVDPILQFIETTVKHFEVNGFTFEDFEISSDFISFFDSIGYIDFHNNIVRNIDTSSTIIVIFPDAIVGAVLRMNNNVFMENNSESLGVAINFNGRGDLTLKNNKFLDNKSEFLGGVIAIFDATLHMLDNHFEGNSVGSGSCTFRRKLSDANKKEQGKKEFSTASMKHHEPERPHRRNNRNRRHLQKFAFDRNNVRDVFNITNDGYDLAIAGPPATGGVLFASNMVIFSEGNKFINNFAAFGGGAIAVGKVFLYSNKDVFIDNDACTGEGGALFISSGSVEISNAVFRNNKSVGPGGAISMDSICAEIVDTSFEDNEVFEFGSAIYLENGGSLVSKWNTYKNNTVAPGLGNGGTVTILGGRLESIEDVFEGNIVGSEVTGGGALYLNRNAHLIRGAKFIGNEAPRGGAFYCFEAVCTVKDSFFQDNIATIEDGGNDISVSKSFLKKCENTFLPEMSIDRFGDDSIIKSICEVDAEYE